MIESKQITGLILAGGRGSRMGGVDKGLQQFLGMPLVQHTMKRLAPQVGSVMFNANRNLDAYRSFGVPAWPDATADFAGPLAGFLVGLEHCQTPYLVTAPCDTPEFPDDLVARLAQAIDAEDAELAMVRTADSEHPEAGPQLQPVFCLLRVTLRDSLMRFMTGGGRKIDRWTAQHRVAVVDFPEAAAFFNANTLQELRELEIRHA
jgi:molybdopterin-guanine dinucleotide biosynthesis protein A